MSCGYEDNYEVCTRCGVGTRDIYYSNYDDIQLCEDCLDEYVGELEGKVVKLKNKNTDLEKENRRLRKLKRVKAKPSASVSVGVA